MRHRVFIESKLAKIVESTDWKKTLNMNNIMVESYFLVVSTIR